MTDSAAACETARTEANDTSDAVLKLNVTTLGTAAMHARSA